MTNKNTHHDGDAAGNFAEQENIPVPSPDSVRDMGEGTGPNMLNPTLSGTFTELCNLDPAARAIKTHLENGADPHFLLISAVEHYAPIALKYDPATAARLEEVTKELEIERMRVTACGVAALMNTEESMAENLLSSDSPYYSGSYEDVIKAVKREMALRKEVERYREALRALTYDYRAHCNGVETPGLYRAESLLLSGGAIEQSTEQVDRISRMVRRGDMPGMVTGGPEQ